MEGDEPEVGLNVSRLHDMISLGVLRGIFDVMPSILAMIKEELTTVPSVKIEQETWEFISAVRYQATSELEDAA